MSSQIVKYESLHPKAIEALEKEGYTFKPGEWYLKTADSRSEFEIIQITNIKYTKKYKHTHICFIAATDWECDEFGEEEELNADQLHYYGFSKIEGGLAEFKRLREESLLVIEEKISIQSYKENSINLNEERALVGKASKELFQTVQGELENKKKGFEMILSFVSYEMERRRQELESIKDKMYLVLADFNKKIKQIVRIITSLELYLGVEEEIHQIQDGQRASISEPISFRQQVLYMDEEIGHWKDGGLDFQNVDWFDKWLCENDNYKRICPEKKCVIAFRPRRFKKEYNEHWMIEAAKHEANMQTYILIRNGDCLFRIYTEKITIYPRLFPQRKEFDELMGELNKSSEENLSEWDRKHNLNYNRRKNEQAQSELESMTYYYRQRAFLMQGLIDRTEIFHPVEGKISVFDVSKNPDAIQFIFDDELTLPTGKVSFDQWQKSINGKITEGSRVLLTGHYRDIRYQGRYDSERWLRYSRDGYYPPKEGVYEVYAMYEDKTDDIPHYYMEELERKGLLISKEEKMIDDHYGEGYHTYETNEYLPESEDVQIRIVENKKSLRGRCIESYRCRFKRQQLFIKYNPGGIARSGWDDWEGHERKNRVGFKIYKRDGFILNYDQIDLADIEFYLTSRIDRPNYLDMMPVLEKIKQQRLKEIEKEQFFIRFVVGRNIKKLSTLSEQQITDRVIESIAWWKYKNKWKRPVAKDDTLALRMIEKRILSKNYNTFKKIYNE